VSDIEQTPRRREVEIIEMAPPNRNPACTVGPLGDPKWNPDVNRNLFEVKKKDFGQIKEKNCQAFSKK
jgi:hypothetical protein